MYCSRCGQAVGAQSNCPNCGAPTGVAGVTPPAVPGTVPQGFPRMVPLAVSRVVRHLHTLGILWTVFAVYSVLHWLLVLPFLHMALGGGRWMSGSDAWMMSPFHPGGWLLHFIAIVVFARALLSLAVGMALLTRQPWGRIFAIIVAVLTLIKPFLGTILAIYTLWVLLETSTDQNYAQLSATRQP
ncbi:MAG: zinc ribbon domain-containing protein [Acidobacteriaceae bacterium]